MTLKILEIDAESLVWASADLALPDSGYSVELNCRLQKRLTASGTNKEDYHATGSCDDD